MARKVIPSIIILTLIFIVINPLDYVAKQIGKSLEEAATAQGNYFELKEIKYEFPLGMKLSEMSLLIKTASAPIPFFIEESQHHLRLLPSLLLERVIENSAKAYDGDIFVKITTPFFGSRDYLSFTANNLQLNSHPLGETLGIKGLLNIDGQASQINEGNTPELVTLDINTTIKKGFYRGGHTVGGILTIPEIRNVDALIALRRKGKRVKISNCVIESSLGEATADGFMHLTQDEKVERANFEIKLALSDEGLITFGGYLSLATGNYKENPSRFWKIIFRKKGARPFDVEVREQSS